MAEQIQARPDVTAVVTVAHDLDVAAELDHWTLEQVRDYVDGDDDEAHCILMEQAGASLRDISSHRADMEISYQALSDYLEWREAKEAKTDG